LKTSWRGLETLERPEEPPVGPDHGDASVAPQERRTVRHPSPGGLSPGMNKYRTSIRLVECLSLAGGDGYQRGTEWVLKGW
jgi:hypothetical protein